MRIGIFNFRDEERRLMNVKSTQVSDPTRTCPSVSIVIPSYNSSPHIRKCLQTLQGQKTTHEFEVIVVDSSFDGTDRIVVEEFSEVRLFHFPDRCSVGKARNIGVEKARGDIVLFLDTDCIPAPTWINDMFHALQTHEVDGVGGGVENGTPWNLTGSVGFYLEFFRFLKHKGSPYQAYFFMGGNSGFRKEVCQSIPFKDLSVGDDFLFAWNMAKQGKSLMFVPSAVVRHVNRTGLRTVLRYQYLLGKGACLYRQVVSPTLSKFFKRIPFAIFLTSPLVLFWMSGIVLRRRNVAGWVTFGLLIPVLLLTHFVWAWGFFREVMNPSDARSSMGRPDKGTIMSPSEGM